MSLVGLLECPPTAPTTIDCNEVTILECEGGAGKPSFHSTLWRIMQQNQLDLCFDGDKTLGLELR